ncbi:MAG: hypothetical protein J7M12_01650 [Candidatus Hydrogenedentes bacterium]|nr:hypothetical protein [Candidatus Hydrogenedentota bacterium]
MSVNVYDEDKSPRHAYPRPTLVRPNWINLNGTWTLEFDDEGLGLKGRWYRRGNYSRTIAVPFPFESALSGIGDRSVHPRVWCSRRFDLDKKFRDSRWLLHFGAVDYSARVWVNGKSAGSHRGGYTPFSMDITKLVKPRDNLLVVYAEDLPSGEQCRGLQTVSARPDTGSYERTTGIWQTVWLEPVPDEYILGCHTVSTSRDGRVEFEVRIASPQPNTEFMMRVYLGGMEVASYSTAATEFIRFVVNLSDVKCWSPDDPVLYTTEMLLLSEQRIVDKVRSYFGVRTVEVLDNKILLNGNAYYLSMVMDHRYYPDGHYTAPHDSMLKDDVKLAKKLGFNSIRTVQKIPDPRFL